MYQYSLNDYRIFFKEMGSSDEEVTKIVIWRNSDIAREAFFSSNVVTPDSHRSFIFNKKNNDIIFGVWRKKEVGFNYSADEHLIGVTGIIVDTKNKIGEYGRTFIDPLRRKMGYAEETEKLLISYAFNILNLDSIWLDAYTSNVAIINLHYKIGWKYSYNYIDENGRTIIRMHFTKSMYYKD